MGHQRNNSQKLAMLQCQLAVEINAGLETSLVNLGCAMQRGADRDTVLALLRCVRDELITTKNLSVLLANNLKPEPAAIIRENVVPLLAVAE